MFAAHRRQRGAVLMALGEKPQSLEHRTVAEAFGIADKPCLIPIAPPHVGGKTIGDLLNATSRRRIVQHVDDGAMNVRDGDLRLATP